MVPKPQQRSALLEPDSPTCQVVSTRIGSELDLGLIGDSRLHRTQSVCGGCSPRIGSMPDFVNNGQDPFRDLVKDERLSDTGLKPSSPDNRSPTEAVAELLRRPPLVAPSSADGDSGRQCVDQGECGEEPPRRRSSKGEGLVGEWIRPLWLSIWFCPSDFGK
ncbi:hypothetical protein BHM03_00009525 [Ensete ventricosum]|nr:hypothetical protein BHM03_00009525 [Ensete ventricosum]